jgi:menaquinone-dependent protoporphyrinogen oxidase
MQRHQAEARRFVTRNAAALNRIPSAFVSVSLSAGSLNPDERTAACRLAEQFPSAYGWTASIVLSVAGRLAYTQYGFIKRLLMKRIAQHEGAPTDTSRDYEFTDWEKVDTFARALDGVIQERAARKRIAA